MADSTAAGKKHVLTQEEFNAFLARLDADPEQAGHAYERLRCKLTTIFRCRGFHDSEEVADVAMDRIARAALKEEIRDMYAYAATVARYVAAETYRKPKVVSLDVVSLVQAARDPGAPNQKPIEQQISCLDECMGLLEEPERSLLLGWYEHDKSEKIADKRALASKLSVSVTTLRVRAFRIRERVRKCVFGCMQR